jgi:hypothetical protein
LSETLSRQGRFADQIVSCKTTSGEWLEEGKMEPPTEKKAFQGYETQNARKPVRSLHAYFSYPSPANQWTKLSTKGDSDLTTISQKHFVKVENELHAPSSANPVKELCRESFGNLKREGDMQLVLVVGKMHKVSIKQALLSLVDLVKFI